MLLNRKLGVNSLFITKRFYEEFAAVIMFKFRQTKTRVSSPFDNDKSHDSTTTKLVKGGGGIPD